MMGQLPVERVTPDSVFNRVGFDYAGPVYIKYGFVRKPTIIKAYICVFVSLSVKAVHLELVSDLSTDAFIASLRRFVARRGKPAPDPISLARQVNSENLFNFWNRRKHRISFRSSVLCRISSGNLYQNVRHILVAFGNRVSKA